MSSSLLLYINYDYSMLSLVTINCYVEDFVRAQSTPENYSAQLIVVDYCKQSLHHAVALIVASIITHRMTTRLL